MKKQVHQKRKDQASLLNSFNQLIKQFSNYQICNVYHKDKFQYIEITLYNELIERNTSAGGEIVPHNKLFKTFQKIVHIIHSYFRPSIFDVNYQQFSFKSSTHQILQLLPINVMNNQILRFIDEHKLIHTNLQFIPKFNNHYATTVLIKCETIYHPNTLINQSTIHVNNINQLFQLKEQYPLIDTNIITNYFIMNKYKKAVNQ